MQPASGLRRLITRHPLLSFFSLAFVLSWLAVLPLVLARLGLVSLPPDMPVEPFQLLGALAGPTLSAYLVTAALSGWLGVRQLLARYVQWRVGFHWYLLVFFGPVILLTLGAIPFLGTAILSAFAQNLPLLLSFYLPVLLVGVILGPLWEEPGWRGFALPRLQVRFGPLAGTLILGVLWGVWHLPGYFGGWLGSLTPSSFTASMLGITAFAVMLTWVYNNTRGSLLIMILLHSAFNAASAFGGRIIPADLPASTSALVYSGWIPAATYTVTALLIILFSKGRLAYHQERNPQGG
jgi:membrane protease YdiL (CAAX protease family)